MAAIAFCQRDRRRLALGQEAVSGVERLGPARAARRDDLVDDEIALDGLRQPDMNGGIGHLHMEGIGVGIDRDALDPHAPCGFAASDQNALEHAVQYPEIPAYWALRCRQVSATLSGRGRCALHRLVTARAATTEAPQWP
jgi:hypothetical protein